MIQEFRRITTRKEKLQQQKIRTELGRITIDSQQRMLSWREMGEGLAKKQKISYIGQELDNKNTQGRGDQGSCDRKDFKRGVYE